MASTKVKKKPEGVVRFIRKSNDLVEAKYKMDIWETRIFTKMITMIRMDDQDFHNYRIYYKEIIDEFDLDKQNSAYDRILEGALSLMKKTVKMVRETDEGTKDFYANILAGVEHLSDGGKYLDLSFHPKMKPYLLQLKTRFTIYDARNILSLPSSYSIRIYELLKQFEKIKTRTFDLVSLKELVGAIEEVDTGKKIITKDLYPLYGNFKQKVLLRAQDHLEKHTDIKFTFDQIKQGRKITKIKFYISKNIPKSERDNNYTEYEEVVINDTVDLYEQIYPSIANWKTIPQKKLILELLKGDYSEDHIRQAIRYTQEAIDSSKSGINNPAGYFRKMVDEASKQGNLFEKASEEKAEIQERRQKQLIAEQQRVFLEAEYKRLMNELMEKEQEIIDKLLKKNPNLWEEVAETRRGSNMNSYNYDKSAEENLKSPAIRAFLKVAVKKAYSEQFSELLPLTIEIEEIKTKRAAI